MDSRARILAITGVTIIGGAIAYAAYFDHKRRNDADFRKKLRKEKKRVDKSVAQSKASSASLSASGDVSTAAMQEALEQIRKEEPPLLPEEREAYFMHQVGMGEQLSVQGPEVHLTAALSFYRALRVYPSPIELINIYEKTIPPPIFRVCPWTAIHRATLNLLPQMIMDLTKLDVSQTVDSPPSVSGSLPDEDGHASPTSGGPPSEASSQEWDKVTDAGSHTPAL
ncbi:hypothetical protein C0991_006240 [Blastosporella zonata]|nr:hypothetical protein C0991_006240 [Blastosporella zonata]